jgi:hypothetical protein
VSSAVGKSPLSLISEHKESLDSLENTFRAYLQSESTAEHTALALSALLLLALASGSLDRTLASVKSILQSHLQFNNASSPSSSSSPSITLGVGSVIKKLDKLITHYELSAPFPESYLGTAFLSLSTLVPVITSL